MTRAKRKMTRNIYSEAVKLKRKRVENFTDVVADELKTAENVVANNIILPHGVNEKARVTFILDNAPLHKGLVGKKWRILNSRRDHQFLLKHKKNIKDFRPEIVHQSLLEILDSRVCKAGMIRSVYVKIDNGVLFEINPRARIPRTFDRFCGLMLDLLQKSRIRVEDTNETLMRVVNEPVTRHFPINTRIIGVSNDSERLVNIGNYVSSTSNDTNLVFVVSAMDHKKININTDDLISISNYPLVHIGSIGMICQALEKNFNVEVLGN